MKKEKLEKYYRQEKYFLWIEIHKYLNIDIIKLINDLFENNINEFKNKVIISISDCFIQNIYFKNKLRKILNIINLNNQLNIIKMNQQNIQNYSSIKIFLSFFLLLSSFILGYLSNKL